MLPFFCLPNFLHFFLSLLAFNELFFYLFIILPFTHTISRWRIKNINFFPLSFRLTHAYFFFYISFFRLRLSALHRDFKRVYVTVFCVYSPLCRCFLSVLPPLGLFLLLMLLVFLTSFFSRLKKTRTRLVGDGARERRNWVRAQKERSRKRRSVRRREIVYPKEKRRTGDNDDTQKEVIQCRRLEIGNVCFHEFHDHPRRVDRAKLSQTNAATVRYTT